MKVLNSLAIAVAAMMFFACNEPNETAELKDAAQRKVIIGELTSYHEYTVELIDAMMTNDHAKQMMMSEDQMTKMMKDTTMHSKMMNNMMTMMEKDTTMCRNMCDKMMSNPNMKGMMQDMMKHQEDIKHQDMIKGKGMMMPEKKK